MQTLETENREQGIQQIICSIVYRLRIYCNTRGQQMQYFTKTAVELSWRKIYKNKLYRVFSKYLRI
jgi:hypothetical protein